MTVESDARAFIAQVEARADPALRAYAEALARILPALVAEAEALAEQVRLRQAAGEPVHVYAVTRAREIASRTAREIGRLIRTLSQDAPLRAQDAILAGLAAAESLTATAAPGSAVAASWTRPPLGAVQALVGAAQGAPLSQLLDEVGRDAGVRIRDRLVSGLLAGRNPRVVGRVIREEGALSAARAMTIARTESLRAFRVSSLAAYEANGITQYQRLAVKGPRTCPMCLALDGQIQESSALLATHPNDRCAVVPVVPGFAPPRTETGAEWLARQPAAVQDHVLGKGAATAYRGGVPLSAFVTIENDPQWGPTLRQTPLREIA